MTRPGIVRPRHVNVAGADAIEKSVVSDAVVMRGSSGAMLKLKPFTVDSRESRAYGVPREIEVRRGGIVEQRAFGIGELGIAFELDPACALVVHGDEMLGLVLSAGTATVRVDRECNTPGCVRSSERHVIRYVSRFRAANDLSSARKDLLRRKRSTSQLSVGSCE